MSNRRINKPATSDSKILPHIPGSKFTNILQKTQESKHDYRHNGNNGFMSMSPFKDRNELKTNQSPILHNDFKIPKKGRYYNQPEAHPKINTVVRREKVQFYKFNNSQATDLNSTFINDDRFIYIIPEGSDITSIKLKVVRINLTDYAKFLIPKNFFAQSNAKVKKMGTFEKLKITNPSEEMNHEIFRMIIEKLENIIPL